MPPEAVTDEPLETDATGVDLDAGAPETDGGEADEAASPAEALRAFDEKLVSEILKTPPADKSAAGAEVEKEDVKESPAKAGAASDDDEEEIDDPTADLRAELAALKEELRASREGSRGPNALLEAAVSESPEIQQLESEMRAAEAETKTATARANEIIREHSKLEKDIAKLEGKLEIAPDVDKLDIRDELREKRRELKDLVSEYNENVRTVKAGQTAQKKLNVHKAEEIDRLKQALANRSTQAEADRTAQKQAKATFNAAFKTEAEKYGIDATRTASGKLSDPKARHIEEVIKARVTLHLRRLQAQDPNAPAVDVAELTAKYWRDEAQNRGLSTKKAFTAASTERRESRNGTARPGSRSASPSPLSKLPPETLQDGAFWMDRAARVVGEKR